jgi:hypothetical protein
MPGGLLRGGRVRMSAWLALGAAALAGSMTAHAPARWVAGMLQARNAEAADLAGRVRVSGTVWNGQVRWSDLVAGEWSLAPWASLAALAPSATWRASASGVEAIGQAAVRLDGIAVSLRNGSVSWDVVRLLAQDIPLECDVVLTLDTLSANARRSGWSLVGNGATQPGMCSLDGAKAFALPALGVGAHGANGRIEVVVRREDDPEAAPLVRLDGELGRSWRVTISEDAVAMARGAKASGPIEFEMRPACQAASPPGC